MSELKQLLEAIEERQNAGIATALATVVRVKGSAYRREGTKMMIDADGSQVCMISGGCLEEEVGAIAQEVIATGKPKVHFFDLDEDVVWGLGLGCGGSVDVYIESFQKANDIHSKWIATLEAEKAACLLTIIESENKSLEGLRMFVDAAGNIEGSLGSSELEVLLVERSKFKMSELYPRSETKTYKHDDGSSVEVFLDVYVPPPELVIFGAGHDAIPMADAAHTLGYRLTVVDARHAFVTEERFPNVQTLIRTHPSGFEEKVSLDERSYVIIMNHHLDRDKESLVFSLNSPAAYIGLLGPRSRFERIVDALKEDGVNLSNEDIARVRNPIGVDIGADTAEEIAVSVMSELLALRAGYQAGFLNDRDGRIHVMLGEYT